VIPSPHFFFCLAEDILSRKITKLVEDGRLEQIKATRNTLNPSHSLYVDDIMIYCNGKQAGLDALSELFTRYALASGQIIIARKSTIFHGSI